MFVIIDTNAFNCIKTIVYGMLHHVRLRVNLSLTPDRNQYSLARIKVKNGVKRT